MPQVTVGCKLPNGVIIKMGHQRVHLQGENSAMVIGGHGITHGVDKELFDAWMEKHKDYEPVKQGLIFAHEKEVNTRAEATEKIKNKNGAERLDPEKPAPGIKKADDKA